MLRSTHLRTTALSLALIASKAAPAQPASARATAGSAAGAAETAQPAATPVPPSGDASDIVVTARRLNERLQDVPAAISVIGAATLESARVRTGKDFTQLTSGVSIITGAINAGDVQINIRGINGARTAPGNVALVVDGVQKSSTAALVQNQACSNGSRS